MYRAILILLTVIACIGCDRAKTHFDRCLQLEQSDPNSALDACRRAIKADPNSKSGQAATEKVGQLLPTVIRLEQEREAQERTKRVTPAQQSAQAGALEQRMKELRAKIHRNPTYQTEDDHCAGEGKPGHAYRYGGGTFSENESLASSDGCVPFDDHSMGSLGNAQNHFCCP